MGGIFIGSDEVTKIYHGATLLNTVYCGEDIIFPNVPPVETNYLQDISTGDRTALITLTNTGIEGFGDFNNLIRGSGNFFFYNRTNESWQNLKFTFLEPRLINGFRWQQDHSNQGNWVIEGSNNDSTWTTFGDPFTLFNNYYEFPNSAAWRYYRLRCVSGSRTSGPFIYNIQFKAAPA